MILLFSGLLATACASVDQNAALKGIGNAQSAVNQAKASHADDYAALELKQAEDKLARANQALDAGNARQAKYLADEADVQAQLAETKAQSAKTNHMLQELQDSISQLRREIQRSQPTQ